MAKVTCIGILVADLLGRPINRLQKREIGFNSTNGTPCGWRS